MNREWYETYNNVTALGSWLIEQGLVDELSGLQYFYEKPWNWGEEYEEYLKAREQERRDEG